MRKGLLVALLPILLGSSAMERRTRPSEAPPLLTLEPESPIPPHPPDLSVTREAIVRVDLALARDPHRTVLRLPTFGATSLKLTLQSRKVAPSGNVVWSGRVVGQPASSVVLAVGKAVLIGNIATQVTKAKSASYYEIRYLGEGKQVLRQYDPASLAPEELNPSEPSATQVWPARDDQRDTCTSDPPSPIDALVVYTPRARDAAGGTEAMELSILLYIEQTNKSFANSGVKPRIRLVHTQEVDYDESGSTPENDRDVLQDPAGQLAQVHGIRDVFGADIVGLIVEYTQGQTDQFGCGYAFVMETVLNAFESWAFAAIPRICADRLYSLSHEFGHLMGARHDWYVGKSEEWPMRPFPDSHGYIHLPSPSDPGPAFRTLMSKSNECADQKKTCDRVLYWSNPYTRYPPAGSPMGAIGRWPSYNARTLNKTAPIVANFRCSQP
jgi:hypothetical protein